MFFSIVVTCAGFGYFVFNLLVGMGWYKAPLLARFERYGIGNDTYTILPALMFSFVVLLIGLTTLLAHGALYSAFLTILLPLLALSIYCVYHAKRLSRRFPMIFLAYPRWYADLRDRTTREERRRIAYRWLVLPKRTRLHYNSNDRAFTVWADFVILATTLHTVEDDEDLAIVSFLARELYY
ncbi:MAG: hypothetical protein IAE80_12690 [Anaerolinea sp.]|nr:hypothetical protein [Anaerolinea sp.]